MYLLCNEKQLNFSESAVYAVCELASQQKIHRGKVVSLENVEEKIHCMLLDWLIIISLYFLLFPLNVAVQDSVVCSELCHCGTTVIIPAITDQLLFTQPPSCRRRMRICFADVFFVFLFFVFVLFFFPSTKTMRQPFSGTAERIFMKLLPDDAEENVVWNVVPPLGESRAAVWRMANVDDCVIYDMTLSQSPEGAT